MTPSIETAGDVWVGQLWAAEDNRRDVLRVSIVDPYLGLVEFVDQTQASTVQSTTQFLETHHRLQLSPKLPVGLRSAVWPDGVAEDAAAAPCFGGSSRQR
jgi:hypothetical protein